MKVPTAERPAENLEKLAASGGKYIVCMSTGGNDEVSQQVLTHPGRFKTISENLQVKEVVIGDGERRRRDISEDARKRLTKLGLEKVPEVLQMA